MANSNTNSITSFIANFGGGSRQNRFTVSGGPFVSDYHIRAATFPASTIAVIAINYRGRTVPYPGERSYLPWTVTILDDAEGANQLFERFHAWSNSINNHTTNLTSGWPGTRSDISVSQLTTNTASVTRACRLQNAYPQSIGELQYDMSQDNTLLTFSVTIGYSHYLPITT